MDEIIRMAWAAWFIIMIAGMAFLLAMLIRSFLRGWSE